MSIKEMNNILEVIISYGLSDIKVDDKYLINAAKYLVGRDKSMNVKEARYILSLTYEHFHDYSVFYTGPILSKALLLYGIEKFDIPDKDISNFAVVALNHDISYDLVDFFLPYLYKHTWIYLVIKWCQNTENAKRIIQKVPKEVNIVKEYWFVGNPHNHNIDIIRCFIDCGYFHENIPTMLVAYNDVEYLQRIIEKIDKNFVNFSIPGKVSKEMYELLYKYGRNPLLDNSVDLRRAIRSRNRDLIEFLVKVGCDINALDSHCLRKCKVDDMPYLMSLGAQISPAVVKYAYRRNKKSKIAYLKSLGYSKDSLNH